MQQLNYKNISKELQRKSGIYEIIINEKSYIGSSIDLYSRLREHYGDFINQSHSNKKLLRAWNKYKEAVFQIVEFCENEKLIERENYYWELRGYYCLIKPDKTVNSQCKEVYQFDLDRNPITSYHSVQEAYRKTGIGGISSAIKEKRYFAGKFIWGFKKECPDRNHQHMKKVSIYDKYGYFVKQFYSALDAETYIDPNANRVSSGIPAIIKKNQGGMCKGYYVSYDKVDRLIDIHRDMILTDGKRIVKYFVTEYECADYYGITVQFLRAKMRSKTKSHTMRRISTIPDGYYFTRTVLLKSGELMENPEVDNHEPSAELNVQ